MSFESLRSVDRHAAGGFEWYLPDVTAGLRSGVEAGVSWSVTVSGIPGPATEWLPHVKWRLFETKGVTIAAGASWHVPPPAPDADRYGLVYAVAGRELGGRRPASLTAGVYTLVDRERSTDTRRGVGLGWEQPIATRWSFDVDWMSGRNWYGYLTTGLTYSAGPQWLFGGYCFGNDVHANHGPCVSLGRSF